MSNDKKQSNLDDLGARVAKARRARLDPSDDGSHVQTSNAGVSQAFRIGVDMLSALMVGTGMGWFLDKWLDTKPWFLIIFLFLGGAAGILNVYRAAMRMTAEIENELKEEAESDAKTASKAKSVHKESEK